MCPKTCTNDEIFTLHVLTSRDYWRCPNVPITLSASVIASHVGHDLALACMQPPPPIQNTRFFFVLGEGAAVHRLVTILGPGVLRGTTQMRLILKSPAMRHARRFQVVILWYLIIFADFWLHG